MADVHTPSYHHGGHSQMHFDFSLVKKHKWAIIAIVGIGALLLFYYFKHKGSASSASGGALVVGSATNPQDLALQQQAQAIQGTLAVNQQKAAADFAMANLQAQTSTVQQVNAIQGQENLAAGQQSTQIELAKLSSGTQLGLADINANTQLQSQAIAANQAIAITQYETAANVAINSANTQLQSDIAKYQSQAVVGEAQATSNAFVAAAQAKSASDSIASLAGVATALL